MTPRMRRRYPILAAFLFALICVAYFVWRNLP
jgi:hypothetical protein